MSQRKWGSAGNRYSIMSSKFIERQVEVRLERETLPLGCNFRRMVDTTIYFYDANTRNTKTHFRNYKNT